MLLNFTQELERSRDGLDYHQVWRYTKAGKTPRLLFWLVKHPNLLQALIKDAQDLEQQRKELEREHQ